MRMHPATMATGLVSIFFLFGTPMNLQAQSHAKHASASPTVSISLTPELKVQIRDFYVHRGTTHVEALPPGIRKRLARGKPLPPGIAKRFVPDALRSRVKLPSGFEIVEVGLDVVLVEVATQVVHDVLMDVVT